jgi:uncharacterized membrane protein YfcA
MQRTPLSIPEIAIIGGTRAMLGAGVGMLVADHLNSDQRRAIGWTLAAVGALTTIPIVAQLVKSRQDEAQAEHPEHRRFAEQEAQP